PLHGDRCGNQLAHVALDVVVLHEDRRPDDGEPEHRLVPAHGLFDVGHADRGVGEARQHSGHPVVGTTIVRTVVVGVSMVIGVVVGASVGGDVIGSVTGARVTGVVWRVVRGGVVVVGV